MRPEKLNIHHQKLNILVADDEAPLVKSLNFALLGMGNHVNTARTGAEAFIKIREAIESQHPFDLLLLDLKMPKISGIELIALLKKMNIKLNIIVMSNYDSSKQLEKLGLTDFLAKPFSKAELAVKIAEIQKKVTLKPDSGV